MNTLRDKVLSLLHSRNYAAAEEILKQMLASSPETAQVQRLLGQVLEQQGKTEEAINAYNEAIRALPGHAVAHTRRSILLLRDHFQLERSTPPEDTGNTHVDGVIGMSTLGANGRFGNQLLQYGFLRMVAHANNLRIETPEWTGRYLFGLHDAYPGVKLTPAREDGELYVDALEDKSPVSLVNKDLWGYCCYHTRRLAGYADLFRSLYTPCDIFMQSLDDAYSSLQKRGNVIVTIHLRRSDFGEGVFWIAPEHWYAEWLKPLWNSLEKPVLYIATDDPESVLPAFREFNPVIAPDISSAIPGAEFFHDFYMMTKSDYLAISNSTFSFTASMINNTAKGFFRPDKKLESLREFNPWNANVLLPS